MNGPYLRLIGSRRKRQESYFGLEWRYDHLRRFDDLRKKILVFLLLLVEFSFQRAKLVLAFLTFDVFLFADELATRFSGHRPPCLGSGNR